MYKVSEIRYLIWTLDIHLFKNPNDDKRIQSYVYDVLRQNNLKVEKKLVNINDKPHHYTIELYDTSEAGENKLLHNVSYNCYISYNCLKIDDSIKLRDVYKVLSEYFLKTDPKDEEFDKDEIIIDLTHIYGRNNKLADNTQIIIDNDEYLYHKFKYYEKLCKKQNINVTYYFHDVARSHSTMRGVVDITDNMKLCSSKFIIPGRKEDIRANLLLAKIGILADLLARYPDDDQSMLV